MLERLANDALEADSFCFLAVAAASFATLAVSTCSLNLMMKDTLSSLSNWVVNFFEILSALFSAIVELAEVWTDFEVEA